MPKRLLRPRAATNVSRCGASLSILEPIKDEQSRIQVEALRQNAADFGIEIYDIDDDRGRWVVVNFFASWCIPCEVEHPEFIEFSERHADGSAQVVSVLFGDTAENAQRFFDERGGDWPVIVDADTAPADFVVLQVPETFLVAPSGLVVGKWEGEITADQIDGAIDALLAAAG